MKDYTPILIEGAMDVELSHLLSCLENREDVRILGFNYYKGTIKNVPVVLVETKMGIVNATLATACGIQKFNPKLIISQGTAGGHNPDLKRGDIVLGEKIFFTDSHLSDTKNEGEGINPDEYLMFVMDIYDKGQWTKGFQFESDKEVIDMIKKIPYRHGKVITGTIGTSFSWNREVDMIKMIRGAFNTDCEEMETAAVSQTCMSFDIPFLSVRIISNSEMTGEGYDRNTAIYCQEYIVDFLESLKND